MANSFHDMQEINSKSLPMKKAGKMTMRSMEYKPADNGGHVFTHHKEDAQSGYHPPEVHTFGKEEGHEALAHFAKHSGLSEHMGGDPEEEDEPEGDEASAAGAAT